MTIAALRTLLKQDDYAITLMDDGTGVLMDLRQEVLLTLNDTAAVILAGIDEGATEDDIVTRVILNFEVDEAAARSDVESFLAKLEQALGMAV